jgi:hypothetical protein
MALQHCIKEQIQMVFIIIWLFFRFQGLVCQELVVALMATGCFIKDEGRPFETGLQGQVSNQRMRL